MAVFYCMDNQEWPLDANDINKLIQNHKLDNNAVSDGYHTFGELYEHRIVLYITLASMLSDNDAFRQPVWRSKKHSDGTEWEGWFLLGIFTEPGKQITYHLPMSKWDDCKFAQDYPQAPPFDGHTSTDVLKRLSEL